MNKFFLLLVLTLAFLVILADGIATYSYTRKTATLFAEKKELDREETFFQINRNANKGLGSGLGLSICKAYSQLLGYKLSFQSELGKGVTFTLDLS